MLEEVRRAAQAAKTAVVLFIDELQYLPEEQFGALISALHRCVQNRLPVTVVGAGLPQLRGLAGDAKSYAERLFEFPVIDALKEAEARIAIDKPARDEGVAYTSEAVAEILAQTQGYPYFLQEWGKHSWDVAQCSPITPKDVRRASIQAIAALDESFFRVRFGRLTPSGEEIPARHGRTWSRPAPLRRHLRGPWQICQRPCAAAVEHHRKGHDLEPQPWRYRLYRPALR